MPEKYLWLVKLNPLTQIFKLAREPIYECTSPSLETFGISAAVACGSLLMGWIIFHRLSRGFYLHL